MILSAIAFLAMSPVGKLDKPAWNAKASYKLRFGNQPLGSSTLEKSLGSDGSLTIRSIVKLTRDGRTNVTDEYSFYDSTGRLAKYVYKVPMTDGSMRVTTKQYSKTSCTISVQEGGKTRKEVLQIPKGATAVNPSVFWFIRTTPRPGAKVTVYAVDDNRFRWNQKPVTYVGPAQAVIGNKKYPGHLVIMPSGSKYILDGKGMPITMAIGKGGDVIYERQGLK